MEPLYLNTLDSTGNFVGSDPLTPTSVPIKTSFYPYFNPSIYQSFTFYSFPSVPISFSSLIGTSENLQLYTGALYSVPAGITTIGDYEYETVAWESFMGTSLNKFSTFATFYASSVQLQSVTYSIRFGTELQTLYGSADSGVGTSYTYESDIALGFVYYSYVVYTYYKGLYENSNVLPGLYSFPHSSTNSTVYSNVFEGFASTFPIGSSSFVDLMGSNVYSGLIDTTNSIIIYQNEQVSSYYSQSLSYQVNIANLTAALNSVSGDSSTDEMGNGIITVTTFSWVWESTDQGWTGSQLTDFTDYLYSTAVNSYLSTTYGGTTITNSSVAVTQVQSLITVQNNDLANSQTFMNNAVTTLQSQVSLAGQIIGTLSSIMQSIISNT